MSDVLLELELEKMEQRGINRYKAVLMAAHEARFINDQMRLGLFRSKDKPTSVALQKLFDGRVVESEETESEE
ncbi:MAG: hypothetical protein GF398_19420 [Chitinivibrionales bacterium]|nr:hypothetical protein [Chitinivibrionales bacterium]